MDANPPFLPDRQTDEPTAPAPAGPRRNLPYATYPAQQLLLDLYPPEPAERDLKIAHSGGMPPAPVVLWLHSGGWRSGSKDHCPIRWLCRFGYAVAAVNYRLLPRHKYPDAIHDAKSAVRFLRAHAQELNIRADAIAASGASAGGYLANMLGVTAGVEAFDGPGPWGDQPSHVQAVVNYFGFTDFVALQELPSRRANGGATTAEGRFLGVAPREQPQLAAAASPITYATAADLPAFLHLHGELDDITPLDQSRRFHEALARAGNTSKMLLVKGGGHGGFELFNHRATRGKVVDFLNEYLASGAPLSLQRRAV